MNRIKNKAKYDIEYAEEESLEKRLRNALDGTAIDFDHFMETVTGMCLVLTPMALEEPDRASKGILVFVDLVFNLGVKYALTNPEKVKLIAKSVKEE